MISDQGVSVGYMEQDPFLTGFENIGRFASTRLIASRCIRSNVRKVEVRPLHAREQPASAGERRRAALARLWASERMMCWTRPTNHLGYSAIRCLRRAEGDPCGICYHCLTIGLPTRIDPCERFGSIGGVVRRQTIGFAEFRRPGATQMGEEETMQRHQSFETRKIKSKGAVGLSGGYFSAGGKSANQGAACGLARDSALPEKR